MRREPTTVRVESTDGVTLALHDLGGSGPALIICHATGFHGRAYGPMARALVDDHRVWALDFRGHGESTPPTTGDFAWNGMAEDLLACADAIGAPSLSAFGHSLGGAAILLAHMQHPGSIDAAYLYEPIVFPRDLVAGRVDHPLSEAARKRREVFNSKADALMRYASRPPLSVLRADALAAYVEHGFVELADGTVRLACRAENEARTFECDVKLTLDRIDGITLPVTIGAGLADMGADTAVPADFTASIVERLVKGRLVRYDHLGHFGPLESPDEIGHDVATTLRSGGGVRPEVG